MRLNALLQMQRETKQFTDVDYCVCALGFESLLEAGTVPARNFQFNSSLIQQDLRREGDFPQTLLIRTNGEIVKWNMVCHFRSIQIGGHCYVPKLSSEVSFQKVMVPSNHKLYVPLTSLCTLNQVFQQQSCLVASG